VKWLSRYEVKSFERLLSKCSVETGCLEVRIMICSSNSGGVYIVDRKARSYIMTILCIYLIVIVHSQAHGGHL
jgi:hypothetical protein